MKTYNLFYAVLALLIIGCSKSDDGSDGGTENEKGTPSDYTLLVEKEGKLTATLLNADATTLTIDSNESSFGTLAKPELTFEVDNVLGMYRKKTDCSGEITIHNFEEDASENYTVFSEMPNCDLKANALAQTDNAVYVAYEVETMPKVTDYFIRILDVSAAEVTFVDVEIDQKPVGLSFANNRLFILAYDGITTEDYKLIVMKADTYDLVHEAPLGLNAKGIFKDPDGNIIIGYSDLHTTFNSATLAFEFTNYGEGIEPNFINSQFRHFDSSGKMYYDMAPGVHSIYPFVPAVYEFDKNNTVLYAYENFLSETQRNFEFEIESTTMVSYDEKNEFLLIGYKKTSGKGGLLRIKASPEPQIVDNLDLDGIPYAIYIK